MPMPYYYGYYYYSSHSCMQRNNSSLEIGEAAVHVMWPGAVPT